jgi:hypothetical protein
MVLFANNKAYLCRKGDFDFYARFILDRLLGLLQAGLSVQLARTDDGPSYRGFSVVPKRAPSDPDLYGLKFWGNRFYKL